MSVVIIGGNERMERRYKELLLKGEDISYEKGGKYEESRFTGSSGYVYGYYVAQNAQGRNERSKRQEYTNCSQQIKLYGGSQKHT